MAAYLELYSLHNDSDLQDRVAVAVAVKAQALLSAATPTAAQVTWATQAITSPKAEMKAMLYYVLAANKSATTAQILSSSDTALQTNVDEAADAIIDGGV